MKNFLLDDLSEQIAVRLNSASWAQKRLIPTFYTPCTSSSWKILFSPIRASWWLLDSFWHPEPKNKWFLHCRHDVRRVREKSSSRIRASWWLIDSFWHPEPKNKWFLLCRHDVRRVHEKFSSRRFERADGCYTHIGILSPKTNDSYFVDIMYVEFMKNFLLADSSELMAVRLTLSSWAQKQMIPSL